MSNPAQTPSLEQLAQAYNDLQSKLLSAEAGFKALKDELDQTKQSLQVAQVKLAAQDMNNTANASGLKAKLKKPENFTGAIKDSVLSWTTHMSNYLSEVSEPQAMSIAVSYLQGTAHEWWIKYQLTEDGKAIETWPQLKDALVSRFDTLNKEKIARDKLHRWRQIKDVKTFNDDFQKIILDIPNISLDEQIDRYTRGLKPYIFKEICTVEYTKLSDAMCDAERIESAHKRVPSSSKSSNKGNTGGNTGNTNPVPMEIGNIQIKKLTPEEREKCMKEGLCLRCRQKGHLAKNCPKGQRN